MTVYSCNLQPYQYIEHFFISESFYISSSGGNHISGGFFPTNPYFFLTHTHTQPFIYMDFVLLLIVCVASGDSYLLLSIRIIHYFLLLNKNPFSSFLSSCGLIKHFAIFPFIFLWTLQPYLLIIFMFIALN